MKHIVCAALLSLTVATAAVAQQVIKVGTFVPPQAPINVKGLQPWIDGINAELGGKVQLNLLAGGTLMRSPFQARALVESGVAEFGFLVNSYSPGRFPDDPMMELPFAANNSEELSKAVWDMLVAGQLRGYDGVKTLALFTSGPSGLHTTKPIRSIADVANMKLRTANQSMTRTIEALKATAVGGIDPPLMSEALSRGVIDGTLVAWATLGAFKADRVAQNHVELSLGFNVVQIAANERVWASLPADVRSVIEKHSGRLLSAKLGKLDDDINAMLRKQSIDGGGQLFTKLNPPELARWEATLRPLVEQWASEAPANATAWRNFKAALAKVRAGH